MGTPISELSLTKEVLTKDLDFLLLSQPAAFRRRVSPGQPLRTRWRREYDIAEKTPNILAAAIPDVLFTQRCTWLGSRPR
jgi:hypothetical protein